MKKLLFILVIMSLAQTAMPDSLQDYNIKLYASSRALQINDATTIYIRAKSYNIENFKVKWSASAGVIIGNGHSIQYIAPDSKCNALIIAELTDENQHVLRDSVTIMIYKQLVFLKADDIVFDEINTISPRWTRFIEYIKKKNIKASLGIIGNSLVKGNQAYFDFLKEIAQSDHFEFWNHGYDHQLKGVNENGEKFREFWNTSYEHQNEHLTKTQNLAKEKLGLTLYTFGAPGNAVDSITVKVLEGNSDIKVWYYGPKNSSVLNLERYMNIEYPTHNPDSEKFKENYNSQQPYLALQMHPCSWDEKRFAEFEKIIGFLIEKDVTFINPFEFYQKF